MANDKSPPVFRFAPSPNGYLHLGHALSALVNFDMAKASHGRLLLRIEDIDAARCRLDYEQAIYEDLSWLGIAWDEPVRRQSEHFAEYRAALERLDRQGLVYPAFETRGEIAAIVAERERQGIWLYDPDGAPLYPGSAGLVSVAERRRRIEAGEPYALRLDMKAAIEWCGPLSWTEASLGGDRREVGADPAAWGDVVLARKETPTSYHLSVVIDDAIQEVTCVVRGQDLYLATGIHRLLQTLLGLPAPVYHHHRLVLDYDGRKLSKSDGATGLRMLRERGVTPAEIRRRVGLA
jgi:glutamyl-Q tRNA(Asp) synthetase